MQKRRAPDFCLAAFLALLVTFFAGAGIAQAHGKEVSIAITCIVPDPARPLTRVCTAFLAYLDGDPVTKADFQLTATREGKEEPSLGPIKFKPMEQEGVYSASVTFPAYGKWRILFQVNEPDKGEAQVIEEILPPVPGVSPEIRSQLRVVLDFGLSDVRSIALRVTHLGAALAWSAAVFMVWIARYIAPRPQRKPLLMRIAGIFPWVAGCALLVLGLSGMFSARYNTPIRPPGLFAPEALADLPFGEVYLMAFAAKMAIGALIIAGTAALALLLRAEKKKGFTQDNYLLGIFATLNFVFGLLMLVNVVVLSYVHLISHVAAIASS